MTSDKRWAYYKKEIVKLLESVYADNDRKTYNHKLYERNKIGDRIDKDKGKEKRSTRIHKERFVRLILDNPLTISQQLEHSRRLQF